jgi:hypothetical protein
MCGAATVCDVISASVLCTAIMTGLVFNLIGHDEHKKPTVVAQAPPPVSGPVRQEGTLIAVSADSVTARSANGYTQTYLLTPNTTVISHGRGQPVTATSRFAINEQVDIIGTVEGGRALATAVAYSDMPNGTGSPMDHVATQAISGAPGNA